MVLLARAPRAEAMREFLRAWLAKVPGTIQCESGSRRSSQPRRGRGGGIRRASCGRILGWTRFDPRYQQRIVSKVGFCLVLAKTFNNRVHRGSQGKSD